MIMAVTTNMELIIEERDGVSLIASWGSGESTVTLALSKPGEHARFIELDNDSANELTRFISNVSYRLLRNQKQA